MNKTKQKLKEFGKSASQNWQGCIIIAMALLLIALIPQVSAETQYFQTKQYMGNGTIQNHLYAQYDKTGTYSQDYITGNNPLELYLLFNIYPKTWNTQNPTNKVIYCNWKVDFWQVKSNVTTNLVNVNYTGADTDIMGDKYFVRLRDGEGFVANQKCYFQNLTYNDLYLPMEMQIITPTWECKACQFFEWSLVEKDIIKAKSIGDNVVEVSNYIKKLFMLNFEIWLAFFWFFLIMCLFASISLIFIVAYWLFLYLKKFIN